MINISRKFSMSNEYEHWWNVSTDYINTSNMFICSDNSTIQSSVGKCSKTLTLLNKNGEWKLKTPNRNDQAIVFAGMKLLSMCQNHLGTLHSTWSYTNTYSFMKSDSLLSIIMLFQLSFPFEWYHMFPGILT